MNINFEYYKIFYHVVITESDIWMKTMMEEL